MHSLPSWSSSPRIVSSGQIWISRVIISVFIIVRIIIIVSFVLLWVSKGISILILTIWLRVEIRIYVNVDIHIPCSGLLVIIVAYRLLIDWLLWHLLWRIVFGRLFLVFVYLSWSLIFLIISNYSWLRHLLECFLIIKFLIVQLGILFE